MSPKTKSLNILFVLISIFWVLSCNNSNSEKKEVQKLDDDFLKEKLIDANKHVSRTENNQIESYIKRRGWNDMKKLDNGLRIWEYEVGKGKQIQEEQEVSLKYRLELINGMLVYSSDTDGFKTFLAGKAQVEIGLDEAVLLLRRGSKAKIIIPSHLGFGFVGDGDQVPKHAILIYDIEVL